VGRSALIVLDVQKAFDDPAWGARNNPDCERNVGTLIGAWRASRPRTSIPSSGALPPRPS